MQKIEFEKNEYDNESEVSTQSSEFLKSRHGALIGILLKLGITDRATINFILLSVAVIFFGVTVFIYADILGKNIPPKQSIAQIEAQAKVMREMMGIK